MLLSNLIMGIVSGFLANKFTDMAKLSKEKKMTETYLNGLGKWLLYFEKKYDGTVVTSSRFFEYLKNYNIIESIFQYYLMTTRPNLNLEEFISSQKQLLIKSLKIEPYERQIIKEFYKTICERTEEFLNTLIPLHLRANYFELNQILLSTTDLQAKIDTIAELMQKSHEIQDISPFQLNGDSCSHYLLWMTRYINSERKSLYANSPLVNAYDEIVRDLLDSFKQPSWKEDIIEVLEYIINQKEESSELIEDLYNMINIAKKDTEYELIWEGLNNKLKAPCLFADSYNGMLPLRNNYNKVYVVSGEPGTGKTHFLLDCLSFGLQENQQQIAFIPLESDDIIRKMPCNDLQWEEFLASKVRDCFNMSISNLSSFKGTKGHRIVFVVDDVHRLYYYNPACFYTFLQAIRKLSKYDCFLWLLSINQFDIYLFDCIDVRFFDYMKIRSGINGLFMSWINLTYYNQKHAIGEEILLEIYNIKRSPFVNVEPLHVDLFDDLKCMPINNPFYAHVLGKSGAHELLLITEHLNFVIELVNYIDKKLYSANTSSQAITRAAVRTVSECVLRAKKVTFSETDLYGLCNPESIIRLMDCSLLQVKDIVEDVLSSEHLEKEYILYTIIFWELKLILVADTDLKNCSSVYSSLSGITEYKEEIIPYYLLYCDYKNRHSELFQIFTIMVDDGCFQYALFASLKASVQYCAELMKFLKQKEDIALSITETFALICYIYYYNAKFSDKYTLLSLYSATLFSSNLQRYIDLAVNKMLSGAKTAKNFKKGITQLFNCQSEKANHYLGYKIGKKYFSLLNSQDKVKIGKQIHDLMSYLTSHWAELEDALTTQYTSFIDYFVRSYFENLIGSSSSGLETLYTELDTQGCLEGNTIGFLMRKNFSCAAGNIYEAYSKRTENSEDSFRSDTFEYKIEYCGIIQRLLDNNKIVDLKFAFHFISNSIDNDSESDIVVDDCFIPYLHAIYSDSRLERFVNERRSFFRKHMEGR